MEMAREKNFKIITERIAWLVSLCDLRGVIHLFDIHTISHQFFCDLLNEIYDLKLEVLDRIQANFPAIDLGDFHNKRSFQITAEKNSGKINSTLKKYINHGLADKYGKLQVLIIGEKQSSYKSVTVPNGLMFQPDNDIIDTKDLLKIIESLDTAKLTRLAELVQNEIKTSDFPSELFLHVYAYNEPPADWLSSDEVRLEYFTEKVNEEIAISPIMPYLEIMKFGGPIQPLRYITPTYCPFDWTLPTLDFKMHNRTISSFFLAEAIFEVEESSLDPLPVIVVMEDVQQSFAGSFWLINEGATTLRDVTIRYELIPGNQPLPIVFPEKYPFQYDVGILENRTEIPVEFAFEQLGLDVETLSRLMDPVGSDSNNVTVKGEDGVNTAMTWVDYQESIKRTLGPFNEEVGTVIGQISFIEETTDQSFIVHFRAVVYIFNKNRRGLHKPPSSTYNVEFETKGKNYQRQLGNFSHEIKPGETDRFLIKLGIKKTSSHRFRVKFRNVDGHSINSPWISLQSFVPRSREGKAKSEAIISKTPFP